MLNHTKYISGLIQEISIISLGNKVQIWVSGVSTYLDVTAEVSDWLTAGILQMEVCPPQQQLLRRQFHQVRQGLPFSQQRCQRCRER